MPQTQTRTVYTIDELSGQARDRARDIVRRWIYEDPPWIQETRESYDAVIRIVAGLPEVASVARRVGLWSRAMEAYVEPYGPATLRQRHSYGYRSGVMRSCPLTGYCADDAAIGKVLPYIVQGCNWREIRSYIGQDCAEAIEAEIDYQTSDEAIDEHATMNEVLFLESGRLA